MRDFDDSTLWRISAYERMRAETGQSGFARLDGVTTLSQALNLELRVLERGARQDDVIEVVAACIRHHETALVLVRHQDLVWPLTLFPQNDQYHVTRPILEALQQGNLDLQVVSVEPPGLRAPAYTPPAEPGGPGFRPLAPLLWALALHAPRAVLLRELGGRVAYRLAANFKPDTAALSGALGHALREMRRRKATLEEIARWPGMGLDRATRLINGVYLQGGLMVLRSDRGAPARDSWAAGLRALLGMRR